MLSKHTPKKLLLIYYCRIAKLFYQPSNLILVSSKHGYVGNAAAFVDQYRASDITDYKIIWMGNARHLPDSIPNASGSSLFTQARLLCEAKFALFTHTPGDVSLYFPDTVTRINLWHGNPIKYILDDTPARKSAYKRHKLCWLNQDPKQSDYFFSGGKRFDQIMALSTGLPTEKILNQGFARNEILFQSAKQSPVSPEYCLYAPTFRDKLTQEDRIENLCQKWQQVFKTRKLSLKIKLHPNDKTDLSFCNQYPWVSVTDKRKDINQLLINSSCLLTDYSSVAFDYLILQKPVYMLLDDISVYLTMRGGTYIEIDELSQIFNCIESVDQLVTKIENEDAFIFDDSNQTYNKRFDIENFVTRIMPKL